MLEYDAHNLYGFMEAIATDYALESLRKQRSFVLGRSTFPGQGFALSICWPAPHLLIAVRRHYAGHWLGDNTSDWPDLQASLPGILNFQMFGIPFVGPCSSSSSFLFRSVIVSHVSYPLTHCFLNVLRR